MQPQLALPNLCDVIEDREALRNAALKLKLASITLKLTGEALKALGENGTDKDVGIHGYVHITIKANWIKTLGTILSGISGGLGEASSFVSGKQSECETLARHAELLGRMDLALRIKIETHLNQTGPQLSVFYLPAAHGGLLEHVRTVVSDTIDDSKNAGLYAGERADSLFAQGELDLDNENYRSAYDHFRQAYRETVEWRVPTEIRSGDASGEFTLSWDSADGADYTVETSEQLVEWHDLYIILNSQAGRAEVKRALSEPTEFYRVVRKEE